jgi:hypothetical protein
MEMPFIPGQDPKSISSEIAGEYGIDLVERPVALE